MLSWPIATMNLNHSPIWTQSHIPTKPCACVHLPSMFMHAYHMHARHAHKPSPCPLGGHEGKE